MEGEDYLAYLPSKLSASSIALARMTLWKKEPWPKQMKISTGYSLKELSPVIEKQNKTYRDSPTNSLQAIRNKYRSEKYSEVAMLQPRKIMFSNSLDD